MKLERREAVALGGLAAIVLISAAWWALALWPAGDLPPEWLARTRAVCFGTRPDEPAWYDLYAGSDSALRQRLERGRRVGRLWIRLHRLGWRH